MRQSDKKPRNLTKRGLTALGILLTAGGLICTVIGSVSFFGALGSGELPSLFFLIVAGLPMMTVGVAMLMFGVRKTAYRTTDGTTTGAAGGTTVGTAESQNKAREDMPHADGVGGETAECAAGAASEAAIVTASTGERPAADLAKAREPKPDVTACPACGAENSAALKFCESCGAPLEKTCPHCGRPVSANAAFCGHCGKKI